MRYNDPSKKEHKIIQAFGSECFESDATCDEDLAIIEALHSGIRANPEFRASLKQKFMAEARADAARRANSAARSDTVAPEQARGKKAGPFYVRFAAIAAAAAVVIISAFTTNWFKPAQPNGTEYGDVPMTIGESVSVGEGGNELAYSEGNTQGMPAGASDIRAMGFAPKVDDGATIVEVRLESALTDDSLLELETIANQAGGSVVSSDAAVEMSIPSEVLDHVLSSIDTNLGIVDILKPEEIQTEITCITLYFSSN